jgi:hypothetical protein
MNVVSHDTTWESTSAPFFIVCGGSTLHSSPWAPLSILAHLRDGPTLGHLADIMSRNAGKHLISHTILTCGPAPQELVQHQIPSTKLKQLTDFFGLLKRAFHLKHT